MPGKTTDSIEKDLAALDERGQLRDLKQVEDKGTCTIRVKGRDYLNLSSNNYLGIGANETLITRFNQYLDGHVDIRKHIDYGSTSSRLLTGNHPFYQELEKRLAELYGREQSLVFNSGYHANIGILSALAGRRDAIFSDKLNHASIIDGMKLSDADHFRFRHLDYQHLRSLLEKHRNKYQKALIVSESVFSMDGDLADLTALTELRDEFDALLVVDEAHAFGVFGENGLGLSEVHGLLGDIDIIVGTFGKAIGSIGAFCVADRLLVDYLVNHTRSFIFTTALPAINLLWTNWILEHVLPSTADERRGLQQLCSRFRKELECEGLVTRGESQIIPVIIGKNPRTVAVAEKLQQHGFWVMPIRPPTVPPNTARLRLSMNSKFEWTDISDVPSLIREALK